MIFLSYKNDDRLVITIDGPAGAGKSTVAKHLAQTLGYRYINTGDLYRYVTYQALKENVNIYDSEIMGILSKKIASQFLSKELFRESMEYMFGKNNNDLEKIHTPEIDKYVSFVARHASVRKNMIQLQRLMAKQKSVVVEGRDIGSVILPNADLKIFLVANKEIRTKRRHQELQKKGYIVTLEEVKSEIIKRDSLDSKRAVAPLTIPKDAIIVDTSNKSIGEVIKILLNIINKQEKIDFGNS